MNNTQNPSKQIAIIKDFLEKYQLANLFNKHKLSRILTNTLYEENKTTPSDEMMTIFNKIFGDSNPSISMLDKLSLVMSRPREAIMEELLNSTPSIAAILPFKYMSTESVIAELEEMTKTSWSCAQKHITLKNDYDHTKHEFSGYFLLKGVSQEEAKNPSLVIDINSLKWGEAVPVSNVILNENLRENYLANNKFDLILGAENDKIFNYYNSISRVKVSRNNLINCIDLSFAFNGTNIAKVHSVALDNLVYDNRNCNYSNYQKAIINVLAKFLAHQPELVLDRLNKKLNFLMEKQNSGEETAENCFEAIERE